MANAKPTSREVKVHMNRVKHMHNG